jgi:probable rRNA maturation factor
MAANLSYQNLSGRRLPASFKSSAEKILTKLTKLTGKKWGEVSLALVTPRRIRQLNASYHGKAKITDVLSFTYQASPPVAGEIVVCLEQAKRQANLMGLSLKTELEFLFCHGCLHLLGYDHARARERQAMRAMEQKVLGVVKARA